MARIATACWPWRNNCAATASPPNWTSSTRRNRCTGRAGARRNSGPRTPISCCASAPGNTSAGLGTAPADVGKGVFWEGTLIYDALYNTKGNRRCVPILLEGASEADLPAILAGYTRFHLQTLGLADPRSAYAKLYRLLTRQPGVTPAELGALQRSPPYRWRARTDFGQMVVDLLIKVEEVKIGVGEVKGTRRPSSPS